MICYIEVPFKAGLTVYVYQMASNKYDTLASLSGLPLFDLLVFPCLTCWSSLVWLVDLPLFDLLIFPCLTCWSSLVWLVGRSLWSMYCLHVLLLMTHLVSSSFSWNKIDKCLAEKQHSLTRTYGHCIVYMSFFDLYLLITPLVSSSFSWKKMNKCLAVTQQSLTRPGLKSTALESSTLIITRPMW